MRRRSESEQDVAAVVVAWLDALGADVYQEVTVPGGVADIVARVHAEIWIVEVKQTLRLSLIAQAMERRRLAHRVFVAAPYTRNVRDVIDICDAVGVGLLEVHAGDLDSPRRWDQPKVNERVRARRWNRRPVDLAAKLKPEHKTHAKAGAVNAAGRWTPFRDTCEQLARTVAAEPGIALKAAIAKIKHHYSSDRSAVSSIATWVAGGKVPGVRLERDPVRLFPVERKDVTR